MPDTDSRWEQVLKWAWDNWDKIEERVKRLQKWFRGSKKKRGILILGAGGTGKTTLARLLANDSGPSLPSFRDYQESIAVERFTLEDDPEVEIVVPPGQRHRREATWSRLEADLVAGAFRGIILVSSFGFHSIGISYRQHPAYRGIKRRFLSEFTRLRREEELAILARLAPLVRACRERVWMLSVISKQDLWWESRRRVERFYTGDEVDSYKEQLDSIAKTKTADTFRHESVFASLGLNNFTTGKDELLAKTVGGYDQQMQLASLRRLFEVVYALMEWEVEQ